MPGSSRLPQDLLKISLDGGVARERDSRPEGTVLMGPDSLLSDRMILSTLLYSIAVLIAFGPELRHSFARIRAERPPSSDGSESGPLS
jgi:hypothetical protein